MNLNQVTLPACNYEDSVAFYRRMGFTQIVHSPPRYARFECPDGDATFSIHLVDSAAVASGFVTYFECDDLDARVHDLKSRGFVFTKDVADERWLWREARLLDPSGNVICLFHAGENRKNPPWRISA
ncbi:MAG: VOC family protein [Rhodanobacteraceae bacterium]|nr:VOC family protein [Rhodanobacteraceae bacterium]